MKTLLSGHRLRMTGVEFVDPAHAEFLNVAFEAVAPNERGTSPEWVVQLSATDPARVTELVRGELKATFDDPQHPEVSILYIIHPSS